MVDTTECIFTAINQYDTDLKKRRVIVSKIDDQWQADLVDMQKEQVSK